MTKSAGPKAAKTPQKRRRPHNAKRAPTFRSIGELARRIGAEPRRATLGSKEVVMTQAERLCRLIVDEATGGSVSALRLLIQTMKDHPQIAASATERWVLFLGGDDAEL